MKGEASQVEINTEKFFRPALPRAGGSAVAPGFLTSANAQCTLFQAQQSLGEATFGMTR